MKQGQGIIKKNKLVNLEDPFEELPQKTAGKVRPKNIKAKQSQLEIEVLTSDNRGWPRRELYKNGMGGIFEKNNGDRIFYNKRRIKGLTK